MMQDWADFLERTQRGGKVLPFRGSAASWFFSITQLQVNPGVHPWFASRVALLGVCIPVSGPTAFFTIHPSDVAIQIQTHNERCYFRVSRL
jgi:hypothetical protein